jgi:cardiolipin synthase
VNARVAAERPWYDSLRPVEAGGHEVVLLQGGDEYFPALCADIDRATAQVVLETYIFEDDPTGRRVAGALARAAGRGVEVHLTVDGFGTPALRGEVHEILRASGVRIETFRPERRRFVLNRRRLRRLHRKIAVIDGHTAFVGGINVLDDRFDPNHGTLDEPRLDFAVRVRGPLVSSVHLAAQRMWWELELLRRALRAVRHPRGRMPELPVVTVREVPPAGRLRAMFVLRDNVRFRRTIEQQYLQAIDAARDEVLIACAYFFPGARFRRALIGAARRGVRVRLLLQGRVEYPVPHYAAQAFYDELLAAGVEIVEYRRSFLHAKVAVIDEVATVGSSNIDPFSLLLAREANVFVFDADFAAMLRARLVRAIEEGGEPVLPVRHARRAWPVRVLNGLAFGLLRLALTLSGEGADY